MQNEQKADDLLLKARALGEDIRELESIDREAALAKTMTLIRKKERIKRIRLVMLRTAAVLSIPLLLASLTLGYLYFSGLSSETQYAVVKASNGSVLRYELPDQSVVWLNAGSTLRYPTSFNRKNREVTLSGEAYFEVTADEKSPFYVHTPEGLSVYVYGTRFDVSAYEGESSIETVLEQGRVNVTTPGQTTHVLHPGEKFIYDKSSGHSYTRRVDVYETTSWKDGILVFRDTPLEDLIKRLERQFNVDIEFNNKIGKEFRYRATFRTETLTQILDYLSMSSNLSWHIEEPVEFADGSLSKPRITVDLN